ncbi:DUF4867 family protein [Kineothrix sp. MB12-C1]|uniref:DUF4867 family protein n=1 Tax=Kineothrix sp. MB12-C1 TaxID=3070215 RepID=UPI0027D28C3D|nr:DUF4867 family protein [Kineothrix sp. MB12-C1]WMC91826.1 DUF4867 family protein [Kineothrix sp. MB12-C1]
MKIQSVMDEAYKAYGRVFDGFDVTQLVKAMEETQAPADAVVYYPSIEELEKLPVALDIKNSLFGELEIQVGYCNGTNNKLNAVEYHRSSEIGVAASDLILLLGKQQDIEEDFSYDSAKIEAFFVPKGTVYEMYATTLHYAPCSVEGKPFRNVVILPVGTNTEVEASFDIQPEDKLLTAKNKWLIAHEEAGIAGAVNGIKGENIAL